ncbi:MAG: cation diffusion facilitator family transporter, partial [Lachnospiraceae bacterium]
MISLLERIFIKDREEVKNPMVRKKYGILCGAVGIFLNILLFMGKFVAGYITNSISITADAINNLSDAGSSAVTLIGFQMAGAKPDMNHPFGHGRIEYVSGLIVSGAIIIMAFELMKTSIDKMIHPKPVEFSKLAVAILLIAIAVKMYMAYYNYRIGKKIESAAMRATAIDSLSDTCATTAVLAASIIGFMTGAQVDGICGVLVGIFIFYAGISAAKDTLNPLLGQPPEEEFVQQIERQVLSHEEIRGLHDLVVHDYGPGRRMISLHAEVP